MVHYFKYNILLLRQQKEEPEEYPNFENYLNLKKNENIFNVLVTSRSTAEGSGKLPLLEKPPKQMLIPFSLDSAQILSTTATISGGFGTWEFSR